MQYSEGKIGRIFVIKLENEKNINEEILNFAVKKKIKTAFMIFLGGLKEAVMAAGPKKAVIPPVPNFISVKEGWEVFGTGSIFTGADNKPAVHIHTVGGRKMKTVTGCLRRDSKVFGVIEVFLAEIKGTKARKVLDPKTGINTLIIG